MDLVQEVKKGLQKLLPEFFTDLGEIKQNDYNLTGTFSKKMLCALYLATQLIVQTQTHPISKILSISMC